MLTWCPKSRFMLVADDNPDVRIPIGCKSYKCPTCRAFKIRERVKLMAWGASLDSMPRFITLTWLPDNWQRARAQVRDLCRRLRKNYHVEWAWAIEQNPKATGYHAHAIQWGDFIPWQELLEKWGGRHIWIEPIRGNAAKYATKCAFVAGYANKNMAGHLEVNGGRAVHMTRGYLHGLTSRQALRVMSDKKKWHLEIPTTGELLERKAYLDSQLTIHDQGDKVS